MPHQGLLLLLLLTRVPSFAHITEGCKHWACSRALGRQLHMAWVAHVCPLCPGMRLGDGRHSVIQYPTVEDIHGRLDSLMTAQWVVSCLLQILEIN